MHFHWIYAALCSLIALRLLFFRRKGRLHRPYMAWLAYLLIVTTASVPVRLVLGEHVALDVSGFISVLFLTLAVFAVRGNVADLFRGPRWQHKSPPSSRL
ncbi:holin [Chitinimonas sp. BJB300]|nr:holin [Chitinimonas sp. BJB300]TSJ88651.1 phage holin family protein [Chitinimonas sp. BJB300]